MSTLPSPFPLPIFLESILPPILFLASTTNVLYPCFVSELAAAKPDIPAPMMIQSYLGLGLEEEDAWEGVAEPPMMPLRFNAALLDSRRRRKREGGFRAVVRQAVREVARTKETIVCMYRQ